MRYCSWYCCEWNCTLNHPLFFCKLENIIKKHTNLTKNGQKRTQKGGFKFGFKKKPMMPTLGGIKGPLAGPIKSTKSMFQKTKSLRPTGFKKTKCH